MQSVIDIGARQLFPLSPSADYQCITLHYQCITTQPHAYCRRAYHKNKHHNYWQQNPI